MVYNKICNLCGADKHTAIYEMLAKQKNNREYSYKITEGKSVPPQAILKCGSCGLIFAVSDEDSEKILSAYIKMIDEKYVEEEVGRRMSAFSILKEVRKFSRAGRLLDIGCCTGFLLDEARKMSWDVYGVEPSKWAAGYAKEKLNLKVYNTTLEKVNFVDNYFDAVIIQDTIEHMPYPKETLVEIKRILKPNGILYISTPNIESLAVYLLKTKWWSINYFHLYYFSKRTLSVMLDITGFKILKFTSPGRIFTLKYLAYQFKRYNWLVYKILVSVSKIDGLKNMLFQINLGDQIAVFAIKK